MGWRHAYRGPYLVVYDPERLYRPWHSSFPESEIQAGLDLRSWPQGLVFYHLGRQRYYRIEDGLLVEISEEHAVLSLGVGV